MVRNSILTLLVIILLASCGVQEETSFNSNFSGKTVTKVDMTTMVTLMSSMDTTGSGKSKFYKEIQKGMDSVKRTKTNDLDMEVTFDTVANALSVSFAFKSLDEANTIAKKLREKQNPTAATSTEAPVLYRWEKKGKVLAMPGLEDFSKFTGQDAGSNPMLSGMTYTMIRNFPKKIVKVSDSRIELSNGNKTMTFKTTASELVSKPLREITVTFK